MPFTMLDPRSALVVIDLQGMVLNIDTQPLSTAEVLDRNIVLAEAFRARDLPVFLVRATGQPPGRTDLTRSPTASRPQGWDVLDPALTGGPHHVITKQTWGAFSGTGLHDTLRELGVTQVVLTGIATSLGVESTARAAHELGYHVSLVTDAMSDRDAGPHRNSITHIFPRLGETGTTGELLELLR